MKHSIREKEIVLRIFTTANCCVLVDKELGGPVKQPSHRELTEYRKIPMKIVNSISLIPLTNRRRNKTRAVSCKG